jgi:spore maturation protein CgeB
MIDRETRRLDIVILGLSITSSWGNGHATTYRGLVRELSRLGHRVLFLERDLEWYADHRDLPNPDYCQTALYSSMRELEKTYKADIASADMVIVGSYVPDGAQIGEWVTTIAGGITAFYDIDTPVTLAKLADGSADYITPELIARYDMYLSFTGGPTLRRLEREFGSPCARPLYCSFDPHEYYPEKRKLKWDLGYMGTYSIDRQPTVNRLLVEAARRWQSGRFVVAGPQYPESIEWPANVRRQSHLAPREHRAFYNAQRFTLNVTRADMIAAGYSPSVRLFEAAGCGTPIVSDNWQGLSDLFAPGQEIIIARTPEDVLEALLDMSDDERIEIGRRARGRVLAEHTAAHRARELVGYYRDLVADDAVLQES